MERLPRPILKFLKYPPQLFYAIGLGPLVGNAILLLTTTGRTSGLPRVTALQYERDADGTIYIGSSLGAKADWYKNILADPRVRIRVKGENYYGIAEAIDDVARVTEFLEMKLRTRPRFVSRVLKVEGLSIPPTRAELEAYAAQLTMIIVRREGQETSL